MKMPEKRTGHINAAILAAKEQGIGAILAFAMKMPSRRAIMAVRYKNDNLTQRCAPLSPDSFVTFSTCRTK